MRLIQLTIIAFFLAGSLLSCDSSSDIDQQVENPVPPSWDHLRSLKFGKFQFNGAHSYLESLVDFVYKGHFGYGEPKWEFTYNEQIVDSANNRVSSLIALNASRTLIDSFNISHGQSKSVCNSTGAASYSYSIRGKNIPLYSVSEDTVIFKLKGAVVKDHLEKISLMMVEKSKCIFFEWTEAYKSTLWNDTITPPELVFTLYK